MIKKIYVLVHCSFLYKGILIYSQTVPQTVQQIGYYPFSGNANDTSENGYNGVLSGDPRLTTDRFGNSNSVYSFEGTDDWIDFGNAMLAQFTNNYDSFSISVWAKSTNTSNQDLSPMAE